MACRYYNTSEIEQVLGVSTEHFHRKIKRLIKRDFRDELKEIGVDNPDIWLHDDLTMRLVDPNDSSNYCETDLTINAYL